MSFTDNIWPFSTINRLKQRNVFLEKRLADTYARFEATNALRDDKLRRTLDELGRADSLLRAAHFRNPETGRLMAKGKLP